MFKKRKTKTENQDHFLAISGREEKKYLIENLSVLLTAGIDIISSLGSIKSDFHSKKMNVLVSRLEEEISNGTSVWKALDNGKLLPGYAISLMKIGEESGRLAENMKLVALQQQRDRHFRSKISSAMMYPALVFFLTVSVGIGVSWFILPRLSSVFGQLKLELPWITRWIMGIGEFLGHYGLVVVPAFVLTTAILIYLLFVFQKTKHWGQFMLFHVPGTSGMIREIELSRTGYLAGTLLQAGIPIVDTLGSLAETSTFRMYKNLYIYLKEAVIEGDSLQKSITSYAGSRKLIPSSARNIIASGEQSGKLPEAFIKVGQIFEERTENSTKNLSVMLEPILLVLVWIGVMVVALAVILPIYSLLGNLNNSPTASTQKSAPESKNEIPVEISAGEAAKEIPQETNSLPNEEVGAEIKKLEIVSTDTGFLNIRSEPSLESKIIGHALPKESYEYEEENDNWYKIKMAEDKYGWVFGKYVKTSKTLGAFEVLEEN
jgi:type IV pilus assembly protein PilC